MKQFLLLIFLAGLLSCAREKKYGLVTDKAMVVTAHPDATAIGREILRKGGNAYDASIAVEFALAVCYPIAGNIGGGGFLVYRRADGSTGSLDFREKAPGAAYRDMYLDSTGNPLSRLSKMGHLAAGVPGTVDGMWEMHRKLGSMPWKDLVQPAIDLALRGVALTEREADNLNTFREDFISANTHSPYLVKEGSWQTGDTLRHNALGATLLRIRDMGREGFYGGETADMMVREMQTANGIISHEDLKNYHSVWRAPITGNYRNYRVISMAPPSSGGIALVQLLGMIEPYQLRTYRFHTPNSVHLMAEAERRVYADRAKHLGDPDFYAVPEKGLQDRKYLRERMENFRMDSVTPSYRVAAGNFPAPEHEATTHFSIVDQWGNAASVTTTLNDNYGSKVLVREAGFLLNDEMDDFSVKPGFPNMFGLIGGEANAIEPGKRMLSSMTPTIVERSGKLYMVTGTPGGATIITSVFQTIMNVIEFDMSMQEAVEAKRFHHQWLPDEIAVEEGFGPAELLDELRKKGHVITTRRRIGMMASILVRDDGKLEAGADPRGDSRAAGF